jgi:5-methylcytosine-specific restriction protein A
VKDYVLARAGGICELCKKAAPFLRPNGEPYLEPHHSRRLSDGGPDHPRWVGAICPTCHRNIHYGKEGEILNAKLEEALALIEPE